MPRTLGPGKDELPSGATLSKSKKSPSSLSDLTPRGHPY
jgi:hypothetical protein